MARWEVVCVRRLDPAQPGRITHLGVDVPRGTQHVPVDEALLALSEKRHVFYIDVAGDQMLLRPAPEGADQAFGLTGDPEGKNLLNQLPDCGEAARFNRPGAGSGG